MNKQSAPSVLESLVSRLCQRCIGGQVRQTFVTARGKTWLIDQCIQCGAEYDKHGRLVSPNGVFNRY